MLRKKKTNLIPFEICEKTDHDWHITCAAELTEIKLVLQFSKIYSAYCSSFILETDGRKISLSSWSWWVSNWPQVLGLLKSFSTRLEIHRLHKLYTSLLMAPNSSFYIMFYRDTQISHRKHNSWLLSKITLNIYCILF